MSKRSEAWDRFVRELAAGTRKPLKSSRDNPLYEYKGGWNCPWEKDHFSSCWIERAQADRLDSDPS